jgi:hypothetical protein
MTRLSPPPAVNFNGVLVRYLALQCWYDARVLVSRWAARRVYRLAAAALLRLALMRRLPLRELQRRRLQTPAHPARPHLILRRRLLSIPRNV